MGRRLRDALGEDDFLGRIDQDRFVILISKASLLEGIGTAQQLATLFERTRFRLGKHSLKVQLSFGVVDFQPGRTEQEMLHLGSMRADAARDQGSYQVCEAC